MAFRAQNFIPDLPANNSSVYIQLYYSRPTLGFRYLIYEDLQKYFNITIMYYNINYFYIGFKEFPDVYTYSITIIFNKLLPKQLHMRVRNFILDELKLDKALQVLG